MLCAVSINGEKFHSFGYDTQELRLLTQNENLVCPECNHPVRFKAGDKRIPHFAHVPGTKCTYDYWEPESEQHLKGKILIKTWLEKLYPDSVVELEYKVLETNQRSDVMVIHPTGEKWAFEYQCSLIPDYILKERHELYRDASVKDYWIFGESVHHYWKTSGEIDFYKHKLNAMEVEALEFMKATYYLESSSGNIRMLYDFKSKPQHSETVYIIEEINSFIEEVFPFQDYLVTSTSKVQLLDYLRMLEELRLEKERARTEKYRDRKEDVKRKGTKKNCIEAIY